MFSRGLGILAIGGTTAALALSTCTNISSHANIQVATNSSGVTWPWRVYKSTPITPPNLNITSNGDPLASGYLFLGPNYPTGTGFLEESGAFIFTSDGDLVFAEQREGTMNFRKQHYQGKPYLTFWNGSTPHGVDDAQYYGRISFLDNTYEETIVLDPDLYINKIFGQGFDTTGVVDVRESLITPQGTMLILAYNETQYDLTTVNGSTDGWITNNILYEIDIATQEVLFSWSALDHIPLNASKQPFSNISVDGNGTRNASWDYFHANSIDYVNGNYLLNARHTWSVLLLSGANGSVLWTFEGETGGDFALSPSSTFHWQHQATAHNATATSLDISFLNNQNHESFPQINDTRPMVFHLDFPPGGNFTATLRRELVTPSDLIYSGSQGSYSPTLHNGNQLVNYGQIAVLREYGPATDGSDLRWQAQFGAPNDVFSYRCFKDHWHATPKTWDPSLVVEDGRAYVSWNGATDVSEWSVYAGLNSSNLELVGCARKKSFETVFDVQPGATNLQVGAVRNGKEIRKSNVVAT